MLSLTDSSFGRKVCKVILRKEKRKCATKTICTSLSYTITSTTWSRNEAKSLNPLVGFHPSPPPPGPGDWKDWGLSSHASSFSLLVKGRSSPHWHCRHPGSACGHLAFHSFMLISWVSKSTCQPGRQICFFYPGPAKLYRLPILGESSQPGTGDRVDL